MTSCFFSLSLSFSHSPCLPRPMNGLRLENTAHEREMSHADVLPIHANPEGGDKQFSERRLTRGKPNNKTARQREYTEGNYGESNQKKNRVKKGPVDRYNSHLHTSKGYLLCPKHVAIIKSANLGLLLWLSLRLSVKGCCAERSDTVLSLADTETCPFCCAEVQEVGQARSKFRHFWFAIGETAGAFESREPGGGVPSN